MHDGDACLLRVVTMSPRPKRHCKGLMRFDHLATLHGRRGRPSHTAMWPRPAREPTIHAHPSSDHHVRSISTIHSTNAAQKQPAENDHSEPHTTCRAGAGIGATTSAMHVPRTHAAGVGEPEYHGGVVGDQATLPEQQDAPYPRLLPPPRRRSSLPGRDQRVLSGDVESWLGRQLTWR